MESPYLLIDSYNDKSKYHLLNSLSHLCVLFDDYIKQYSKLPQSSRNCFAITKNTYTVKEYIRYKADYLDIYKQAEEYKTHTKKVPKKEISKAVTEYFKTNRFTQVKESYNLK